LTAIAERDKTVGGIDDRVIDNKTAPIGAIRTGPEATDGWKLAIITQPFKTRDDVVKLIDEQMRKHIERTLNPEATGWDTLKVLDALMGAHNKEAVRSLPQHIEEYTGVNQGTSVYTTIFLKEGEDVDDTESESDAGEFEEEWRMMRGEKNDQEQESRQQIGIRTQGCNASPATGVVITPSPICKPGNNIKDNTRRMLDTMWPNTGNRGMSADEMEKQLEEMKRMMFNVVTSPCNGAAMG
jgi:hypothetical protein